MAAGIESSQLRQGSDGAALEEGNDIICPLQVGNRSNLHAFELLRVVITFKKLKKVKKWKITSHV
jgi:hypothetical protein